MDPHTIESSNPPIENNPFLSGKPPKTISFWPAFRQTVSNSLLLSLVYIVNTLTRNFSFNFLKEQSSAANYTTAAYGIGNTFLTIFCVAFIVSLNVGMLVESSQFHGQKKYQQMGYSLHRGLVINFALLIPLTLLVVFSEQLLLSMSFEPLLASNVSYFMLLALPGVWAYTIFNTLNFYLNAAKIFKPQTYIQCFNSVLYIIVAYFLIEQSGLGLTGAALAFNLMNLLNAIALYVYIKKSDPIPGSFFCFNSKSLEGVWEQFKSEASIGTAMLAGWIGEEIFTFVSGAAGPNEAAAFMTVIASLALVQTFRIGSNDTSATYFGNAVGENAPEKVITYSKANLIYVGIYSLLSCLVFFVFAEDLVSLYTSDEVVIEKGILLSKVLGLTCLSDGFNSSLNVLLRSLGYERPLLIISIFAVFVCGTPLGIILCLCTGIGSLGLAIGFNVLSWLQLIISMIYYWTQADIRENVRLMHSKQENSKFIEFGSQKTENADGSTPGKLNENGI